MPYYTYHTSFSSGTIWDDTPDTNVYSQNDPAQYAREKQVWVEHQELMDKLDKQAEELQEDKRKYPLFFLKGGIV